MSFNNVGNLHKTPDKIQAITNAPKPENVAQLKSFLGLLIYGKFLPNHFLIPHISPRASLSICV
jgi:hypothetical protein